MYVVPECTLGRGFAGSSLDARLDDDLDCTGGHIFWCTPKRSRSFFQYVSSYPDSQTVWSKMLAVVVCLSLVHRCTHRGCVPLTSIGVYHQLTYVFIYKEVVCLSLAEHHSEVKFYVLLYFSKRVRHCVCKQLRSGLFADDHL